MGRSYRRRGQDTNVSLPGVLIDSVREEGPAHAPELLVSTSSGRDGRPSLHQAVAAMMPALWCLAAYLIGSISWSWLLVRRLTGTDLRTVGSGNLGATNAGRVLGKKWAIGIYVLDLAKGAVAVLGARILGGDVGGVPLELAAGAAAMIGHVFPFYLRFKGGKGVATGSGIVFALAPWTGLGAVGLWLVVVKLSRMVSLASIIAAASLPVLHELMPHRAGHTWRMRFFCVIAVLVVVLHRSNIGRILRGNENKIGSKA